MMRTMDMREKVRLFLLLALLLTLMPAIGHSQDYIDSPQVSIKVPPGCRFEAEVTTSCNWENYLLVSRHENRDRAVAFNSHHARRAEIPYEFEKAGGGKWISEVNNTDHVIVYQITSGHKRTTPKGEEPWVLSRFHVFDSSETSAYIGWDDDGDKIDQYGNVVLRVKIQKVN
jgi:hypothetical protein